MERVGVKKMYQRSKASKLFYKYMVADGDNKSYLDVWDIYGVCNHCKAKKDILTKRASKMYEEWVHTSDYRNWCNFHKTPSSACRIVIKLDCVQHVSKCFRNKLDDIANNKLKTIDGEWVNQKKLSKNTRVQLQKFFSKAVKENVQPGMLTAEEQEEATTKMKNSIMASFYHGLNIENDEIRHQYCSVAPYGPQYTGARCEYKRGFHVREKKHHLDASFEAILLPVYEYYTQRAMLNKMVTGMNTNDLESFNSTIWNRLPKHKFHGRDRVEIAVMLSLLIKQYGHNGFVEVMDALELPTDEALKVFDRNDSEREKNRIRRQNLGNKRFRRRLTEALTSRYDSNASYGPGISDSGSGPSGNLTSTPFMDQNQEDVSYYPGVNDSGSGPSGHLTDTPFLVPPTEIEEVDEQQTVKEDSGIGLSLSLLSTPFIKPSPPDDTIRVTDLNDDAPSCLVAVRLSQRLKANPDESDSGISDSGAVPTVPKLQPDSNPFTRSSTEPAQQQRSKEFVVIPYGPNWYAAKIVNVNQPSNEVQLEFMYSNDGNRTFYWRTPQDSNYEGLFWEFSGKILYYLSDPQLVRPKDSSSVNHDQNFFTFHPKELSEADKAFKEWRKVKRMPKKGYRQ